MSFFGKVFGGGGETAITLNKKEAFVGILYAVIAADGHISQEEVQDFMKTVTRARLMQDTPGNQFRDMINKLNKLLRKEGPEALVKRAAGSIPNDIRPGVFAYACDLVFSDGNADESEQKLLDIIKAEFAIEDALAYKVAEVVVIKNKI